MNFYKFIIFRYLFIDILKPFLIISLVLTGIVWLSRSLNYIELIINKGLSLPVYFWFVSLIAPKILALLLPLISFASISYSYNKLKVDSEIIAMECSGISKTFLMIPALIFGLCVAVSVFIIEAHISPKNYKKFKNFQSDLRNNFVISSLQEGEFHSPYQNITVYIDKVFKNGKVSNVLIHDTRNKNVESTIVAKEGRISNIADKPHMVVFEGSRFIYNKKSRQTTIMNFKKYEFEVDIEKKNQGIRFKQVEERSLGELFNNRQISNKKIINELASEAHRRITSPLLVIFMCLAASCTILFGSSKKPNSSKRIGIVSAFIVSLQALYIASINSLNFSLLTIIFFYFMFFLIIFIPIILVEYEKKILKYLDF